MIHNWGTVGWRERLRLPPRSPGFNPRSELYDFLFYLSYLTDVSHVRLAVLIVRAAQLLIGLDWSYLWLGKTDWIPLCDVFQNSVRLIEVGVHSLLLNTTWFQWWWISILMLFFRSTEVEEPKDFRGTKGTLVKFEKCGFLDFRIKLNIFSRFLEIRFDNWVFNFVESKC